MKWHLEIELHFDKKLKIEHVTELSFTVMWKNSQKHYESEFIPFVKEAPIDIEARKAAEKKEKGGKKK